MHTITIQTFYGEMRRKFRCPIKLNVRRAAPIIGGVSTNQALYSHDLFIQEAEQFIRDSAGGPFFLYLKLTIPHANNQRRKGWRCRTGSEYAARAADPQKGHAAMLTRMDRNRAVVGSAEGTGY